MLFGPPTNIDFLEKRIRIPDGQHKGDFIQVKDVPWFVEPYEAALDDAVEVVCVYKATGGGGTTIGEAASAALAMKRPIANLLYNVHVDSKVVNQADRLLQDQFDNIPELALRYRLNRYDKDLNRERRFDMPSFKAIVQAANESNAQSTRASVIVCDELWQWKQGILDQMLQRGTGDFPFSKVLIVTSAAEDEADDAAIQFESGCKSEFHLSCPKCDKLFLPLHGSFSRESYNGSLVIQWDKDGTIDHRAGTVRMVCPHCDFVIKNTPKNRRVKLLEGSQYVIGNDKAPPEIYSCRFNSWVPWFEPWEKTLKKYLKALQKMDFGDRSGMRDFMIKSMAITWNAKMGSGNENVHLTEDYELIEREEAPFDFPLWTAPDDEWPELEEGGRYMAVDYQRAGHFWVWVEQVDEIGNKRLLWCGKVDGFEDAKIEKVVHDWDLLEELRQYFKVDCHRVGVDAGTDVNEADIYRECAIRNYICLAGSGLKQFITEEDEDEAGNAFEVRVKSPFSSPKQAARFKAGEDGEEYVAWLFHWDKKIVTDFFDVIRTGRSKAITLHLPRNRYRLETGWAPGEYIEEQLNSMTFGDPRTRGMKATAGGKEIWHPKSRRAQDHLWDCASMVLVLQMIDGFFEEVFTAALDEEEAEVQTL